MIDEIIKEMIPILSIDGGGTRGVIPATILDELFKETGIHPKDLFKLLSGTSTGGILACGYSYGIPTDEMLDLYIQHANDIFHDSGFDDIRDGFGKNIGADYSHGRFKKLLKSIFGTTTLGDIRKGLSDDQDLMVCSFDLNPMDNGKPINFRPKVFHSSFLRDSKYTLVDICLMTSAGPTYFPIYNNHIDGGVSLNNPSMAALAFAINGQSSETGEYRHPDGAKKGMGHELIDLALLSLGCGTSNKNYIPVSEIKRKRKGDWGNLQWIQYLPDLLTETNVQAAEYYISQLLKSSQYIRIQAKFDDPQAPLKIRDKVLGLDVKDKELLNSLVVMAKDIYANNRLEIHNLLNIQR
ncbi:patatin-like phospholipase family protein [Fulvivirga sedimenti]|uniref:Patatin-like phospholipase family protein n=1 Tax=Fulvivirga sedimenti TaxID=2879465 RepID=A0A9X1HN04_9BACT|nr:patatin-like phospholipase family protein [Fulvivirga sedimenti]MCA6073990.1 patatin-like phospholipase family protein [Fulvivirga sedimenti]